MKTKKYIDFITEKKNWIQKADVKKGKMHTMLAKVNSDLTDDKNITDVYKSGKKLAEDLLKSTDDKSAIKMLNFAYNTSKEDVFKNALNHIENKKD